MADPGRIVRGRARPGQLTAAERGHDVIIAGRDLDDLERTAADIRISTGQAAAVLPFDAMVPRSRAHGAFAADAAARAEVLNVALVFTIIPAQHEINRDPYKAVQCISWGIADGRHF